MKLDDHKATKILHEGRGQQWEPLIAAAFLRYLKREYPHIELSTTSTNAHPLPPAQALGEIVVV